MSFADKWMELELTILSEVSYIKKDKGWIFSHMWTIDPNNNCIHKQAWSFINTHTENISMNGTKGWD
jgi:hypothetical protein